MRLSLRMGNTFNMIKQLKVAAAADRLSAEPWRAVAAAEFQLCSQIPGRLFTAFEEADRNVLQLAPNSAPDWLASGDWYFEAASKTDGQGSKLVPDALGKAVAAYEKAVELYPNDALCRAKLAEAYRAAGQRPEFRREAEEALRLDRLTPHADRKLPAGLRSRLLQGLK
jgi:tetratricopeptide (TPR) repeat protein